MEILYREIKEEDILTQKKEILELFKLLFEEDKKREKISEMYYENMSKFCKDRSAILLRRLQVQVGHPHDKNCSA